MSREDMETLWELSEHDFNSEAEWREMRDMPRAHVYSQYRYMKQLRNGLTKRDHNVLTEWNNTNTTLSTLSTTSQCLSSSPPFPDTTEITFQQCNTIMTTCPFVFNSSLFEPVGFDFETFQQDTNDRVYICRIPVSNNSRTQQHLFLMLFVNNVLYTIGFQLCSQHRVCITSPDRIFLNFLSDHTTQRKITIVDRCKMPMKDFLRDLGQLIFLVKDGDCHFHEKDMYSFFDLTTKYAVVKSFLSNEYENCITFWTTYMPKYFQSSIMNPMIITCRKPKDIIPTDSEMTTSWVVTCLGVILVCSQLLVVCV